MSLDIEYVSDWNVQDALRELFQNAIDHGDWKWEFKAGVLTITSKNVSLTTRSLLLGHSKKKDGAIGKFGEGYKLASLVLKRLGHMMYIYTGDECWTPNIIKSRTYKTQQLVFDVTKAFDTTEDTIFRVEGIDHQTFSGLMDRNLHLRDASFVANTSMGRILSEDYAGKVFVNGLWVCNIEKMVHGYDMKPSAITLDRDRRIVRDFDLQWRTCQMWAENT